MEPQCDSSCAQVNPDASHLVARPVETGTVSAAGRGFPGPAQSAGTGGRPPAPTHLAPPGCTPSSNTAARDRSASTPPPGIHICRSTAIVRRPWARCLPHGSTSKVRVELKSPILFPRGRPPWRQRARFATPFGARCRSFSQQRIIAQLDPPIQNRTTDPTDRLDSRPRLMTLLNRTEPRPTARITRNPDTVHSAWRAGVFAAARLA